MAGYSYKNSIHFKLPEASEEYNIESCDVLDYHNIKNVLDKINEKDLVIEEYITKYIPEEEKLMTYNFKPTTKNILDSNMLMLHIMNPSNLIQSSQPPDDTNINKPEMIEKMKIIPFHFESEKQRQIKMLKIRYERMSTKLADYDRKYRIKQYLKEKERRMNCLLQTVQLISIGYGGTIFAMKCIMMANLYNPAVWSTMVSSICASPLQFQMFIDFMQNLYIFSASEIITLKELFEKFQIAQMTSTTLQDEKYIKTIIETIFSESVTKEATIEQINKEFLGTEDRTSLSDFGNFIKKTLDARNIWDQDTQPNLDVNKGLFSLAYSYFYSPLGRETLTTLKIALEAYGYLNTTSDFFSTYKTASPTLFFKGIALNSVNSSSFNTYNKILVQNLFQSIASITPNFHLKDTFFLQTEIPILGENIENLFVTTIESFVNVQITSSINGYFVQLEKEAGYDPEAEKKKENAEKENNIDSVMEEIYQRGKKLRHYKSMGYSNYQIARIIDKPERSNNYRSSFGRCMKHFYNFFADLIEDPVLLLDTYVNASFIFNVIEQNIYGLLTGGISSTMNTIVLSGIAHKKLFNLSYYTGGIIPTDIIPMNILTLFLQFKYGNDTVLTTEINKWRVDFIDNISSDLLTLFDEMQSVLYDSSLGMSLDKYLNALNNTIIGNIFKMSCNISRFFLNYIGIPRIRGILHDVIPVFNIPIIETLNDKQKCIRLFAFIDNKFSNIIRAFRESKLIDRLKTDLSQFANIGQIIQGTIIPYLTAGQYFEWKPQLGSPFKGNIVKVLRLKPTDENKNENARYDELLERMTSDIDKKGEGEIEKTLFIIDSDETFMNFKVIQMEDIEKLFEKLTTDADDPNYKPSGLDDFVKLFKKENFAYTFSNLTKTVSKKAKEFWNWLSGSNDPTDAAGNLLDDYSVTNIFYYYYLKLFLDEKDAEYKKKDAEYKKKGTEYKLNNFEFQEWLLQKSTRIMDDMGNMQTSNTTGVEVAIINNILLSFPKRLLTQSAENDWFGARLWSYVSGTQGQLVSKIDIPPDGMEALKQFIGHMQNGAFIDDANFVDAGYGLETTSISKTEFMNDDVFMGVNLRHNSYYGGYAFSPQIIKARDFLSTSEMLLALSSDESSEEIQKMSDLIIKLENEAYSNPSVLASLTELNNLFQEPILSLTQSLQFILDYFTKNFYDEETSENNIPLKHMSFDYGLFYTKTSEMLKKCLYDVKNNVNIFTKIVEFMKTKNKYIVQYLQENCEIQFMCKDADADADGKTSYLNKNGINMDTGDLANKNCLDNKVAIDYEKLDEEQFLRILLRPEIIFQIADNTTAVWFAKKLKEENTKLFLSDKSKQKAEKKLQCEAREFFTILNDMATNGMKQQGIVNSTTLFDIIYDTISEQEQEFNASNEDKKLMSEYSKLYKGSLNEKFWENIAVKMNTKIDENDMVYDKPAAYWEKKYYENYKLESLFKLCIILKDMKKRLTDKDVKNTLIKYFSQKEDYLDKSNIFNKQIDEVNNLVIEIENICKSHLEDTKTFDKKALDEELTKLKNFYDKDSIKGEINLTDFSNLSNSVNLAINKIEIDDAYFKLQKSEFNAIESELTKERQALGQIWAADNICTSEGVSAHFIEYFALREKWYKKQIDLFKLYILYNTNDFYSVFTNRYELFSSQVSNFINEYSRHLNKIEVELQAKKILNDKLLTPSIGDIAPITSEENPSGETAISETATTGEEGAFVATPRVTTDIDDKKAPFKAQDIKESQAQVQAQAQAQDIKEAQNIKEESKISESVGQREGQQESLANQVGYAGASPDALSNLVDGLLKMLPSTVYTNIFAPPSPIESTEIEDTKKSNIKNQLEVCQKISNNWYIKYQPEHTEAMKFQPTTIGDNISVEDANGCKETNLLYNIAKNTNYYIIKISKWLAPIIQSIIDALCRGAVPGGGSWLPHLNPCNGLALWSSILRIYGECIIYIFHDSLKKTFGDMDITKTGELNLGNYLGFTIWLQMINSLSAAEKDAGLNRDNCNMVENISDMNIRNLETDVYTMITERYNNNKYSSNNLPGFINIGQIDENGTNYSNPESFLLALTTKFLTSEQQEEYTDFINNYEKNSCANFYNNITNARKYLKFGLYSIFMNPTKNAFFDYLNCRFFDTTEVTTYKIIEYLSDPKNLSNIWVDIRLLIKDFVVVLFANRELRPFFLTKIFGNRSLGNNKNLMRDLIDKSFSELDNKFTDKNGTFNQDDYEVELDEIVGSTVSNLLQQFWDGLYSKFKTLEEGLPGIDDKIYRRFTLCRVKSCDMKEIKEIAEDAIQHVEEKLFTREVDVDKYFFGEKNWISSNYSVRNGKNDYLYNDSKNEILNTIIGLDSGKSGIKIKDSYSFTNKKGEKTYISDYDDNIKSQIVRKTLTQYKEILSFYKKSLETSKTIKGVVNTRLKEESANFDLIFRYQNYEYYKSDESMEGVGVVSNADVLLNNYLVTPCNLHERLIFYKKDDSSDIFSKCINISVFEENDEYTTFQNEIIKMNDEYINNLGKYHREQSKKIVAFLEILKVDVNKICGADLDSDCIQNITTFINEVAIEIKQKLEAVTINDEEINNFISDSVNQYAKLLDEMKTKYTTKIEEIKKELENTDIADKTEIESVITEVEKIVTMINNIEMDITNNILKAEPYKSDENITIDFIVQEMRKTEDVDYFAVLYLKLFNLQWDDYNSEKQKYILDHIQDIYKLYSLLDQDNITYEELTSGRLHFYIESNEDVIANDVNKKITEDKYKAAILKQFQFLFYKQSNFQYKYTIGKDTDFNIAIKDENGESKIIPIKKDGDGFEMIKPLIEKNNINPINAAKIVKNAQDIIISGLENINDLQSKDDVERIKTLRKQIAENDPNGKKTVDLLNKIDDTEKKKKEFEKDKLAPINQKVTKKVDELDDEIKRIESNVNNELIEKVKQIKDYNDWIDAEIDAYNRITGKLDKQLISSDRKKRLVEAEEKLNLNKSDYDKESARINNEIAAKENANAEILETLNDELQQILDEIQTYIMEHEDITEAEVNQQLKNLINKKNELRKKIKEVDEDTIHFKEEKELERGTLSSWLKYIYWKSKYYEIISEPYAEGIYNWTDPYQWATYFSKWGYEYVSGKKLRPDDITSMIDFQKSIESDLPKSPKSAFDYYLEELNKKDEKITYEDGIQKWNKLWWWDKSHYTNLAKADEKRYKDEMKEFAKTNPKYNIKTREFNIEFLQEEVRDIKSNLKAIQTIHSQFKRETGITKYGLWTKKIEEWQVDQVQRIIDDKDKNIFGFKAVIAGPGFRTEGNVVLDISSKDFEIYGEKFRIHELLQELKNLNDGTQLTTVGKTQNIKITVEEPMNLKAINNQYEDIKSNIKNLKSELNETKAELKKDSQQDMAEITKIERSMRDRKNDLIILKNNAVDTNKELEKEYASIQKIILDSDKSQYEKLRNKGFSLKIASNTNTIGLFPFNTYSDDYETLQKHARNGPINQKNNFLSTSKIDGGLPPILVGVVTHDITEGEINIGLEKQPQAEAEIAKLKKVAKITKEKEWPESPELEKELSSLESSEVHPIEKVSVKRIDKIIEDKYILLKDKDGKPLVDSKGNSIRILKMQIASWNSTFDAFDESTFGEVLVNTLNEKYFRDEETYKKLNAEWWWNKPSQEDVNNAFGINFEEYFNNLPIKGLDGKTIPILLQEGEQVVLPHIPMNIYQSMYDNMMFDLDNNDVRFFIPQNNMVVV
jgi:hypothetical protein